MIKVECVIVKFNLTPRNMPENCDITTISSGSAVESDISYIPGRFPFGYERRYIRDHSDTARLEQG